MRVLPRRRDGKLHSAGALAALRRAAHAPNAMFALIGVVIAQMMMVSVMVMTPASMVHNGMALEFVGIIISVHFLGMYALSPLFGWLSDKGGARTVIFLGSAIFAVAVTLGVIDSIAPHSEMTRLAIALFFIGLGWSACIIGESTLLPNPSRATFGCRCRGLWTRS